MSQTAIFDWVDLFPDTFVSTQNKERAKRAGRSAEMLYKVARHGRKASLSPLVFIDAGLALCDAFAAYARLQQAKQRTTQLNVEIETLRDLLKEQKEQNALKHQVDQDKLHARLQLDLKAFRRHEKNLKKIGDTVKAIGQELERLGADSLSSSKEFRTMEIYYHHLMDGYCRHANDIFCADPNDHQLNNAEDMNQ